MARLQTIPTDPPSGYQLDALLGAGGMGAVYRARQRSAGGRLVALKRIRVPGDAELLARIQREAGVLAGLDHPHIVRCYEFVPDGEGIAIAMQYAAGGSLAERLDIEGRLDAAAVAAIAEPIARALGSAHARGVLHGDVKPANILFTSDGEPLLSDFGIARHCHPGQDGSAATVGGRRDQGDGSRLGTPEYLDPEVAGGRSPDARSDVYSLGVVCYEALTGRLPAADAGAAPPGTGGGSGWVPLLQAIPDCPAWMAAAVERALSRDREARFADAAEFAAALRGGLRPGPITRPFGPRPPAPEPSGVPAPIAVPKPAVWGAAVALLLLPLLAVLLNSAR